MSGDGPWSNQVVQRVIIGEISPGSGLFVYSGAPALGDLLATIVAANGADPYTNVDYAGIVSYLPNGTATPSSVVQLNAGQINMGSGSQFAGTGGASPATVTVTSSPGSGSEISLNSGGDSSSDNPAFLNVTSADAAGGGSTVGIIQMGAPVVLVATSALPPASDHYTMLYANANGTPSAQTNAGFGGSTPIVKTDTSTNTNANQATAQALTVNYTIPANDAQVGTIYELEVPWDALCVASNPIRFDLSIDSSATNTVEASFIPGAISPNGFVRAYLQVITTGAGGTINAFINGALTQNSSNGGFTNSAGFAGTDRAKGVAFDTTVSHTIRINSFWPSSNASQTISGYGSKCTRSGP